MNYADAEKSREVIEDAVERKAGKPVGQMTAVERRRFKRLSLAGLAVSDLTALPAAAPHLTWLSLAYTHVKDLGPLAGLESLTWLDLEGCDVADLSPLEGLAKLEVLGITDTPAADDAERIEFIEKLEKRGVKVYR